MNIHAAKLPLSNEAEKLFSAKRKWFAKLYQFFRSIVFTYNIVCTMFQTIASD